MSRPAVATSSTPTLKLYRGSAADTEDSGSQLSPAIGFAEGYAAFRARVIAPQITLKRLDPRTLREYNAAANAWLELIGDTPIRSIDRELCRRFQAESLQARGLKPGSLRSPATIKKHCTHLQVVLDHFGPRSSECEDALTEDGLYGYRSDGHVRPTPWFPKLQTEGLREEPEQKAKDCYTLDQVEAWINACRTATAPVHHGYPPQLWWETLVAVLWATDMRIGTALAFRRSWLVPCPGTSGDAVAMIPRQHYKQGRRRKEQPKVYFSRHAMEILKRVPVADGPLWNWPGLPGTLTTLHAQRRTIQTAAGIGETQQHFGFQGLRRAGLTALYLVSPDAARNQAGHRDLSTTLGHYVQEQAKADALAKQLRGAHEQIPQPGRGGRQLALF